MALSRTLLAFLQDTVSGRVQAWKVADGSLPDVLGRIELGHNVVLEQVVCSL